MSEGGKKENRDSGEAVPEIEGEAPEAIASEVTAAPVPDPDTDPDTSPETGVAESGDDTSPWKLTDEERIGDLEAEVAELKDQLLRAIAETENVRRRGQREREDTAKYAAANFARDLLAVADNLARALESVPPEDRKENESLETLVTGIELTQRELEAAFERHGIKRIEPMGEPFDHNFHQAMFEIEDAEKPAGTVVQLMQPGYLMRDRLLRPAMVGIAKGGPKNGNGGGNGGGKNNRGGKYNDDGNGGGEADKPPEVDTTA
jgi:molecular chaperone GrpE